MDGGGGGAALFDVAGAWDQASGTLTLVIASGQTLAAGAFYSFSFEVVNPSTAQAGTAVTLSSDGASSDASIYFTTDGAPPTTSSTQFTTAFAVAGHTEVLAAAAYAGQALGAVENATYTA